MSMLENIVKLILGIVISSIIMRYLGPERYGVLSYALSIAGLVSPFTTLGLDSILLKFLMLKEDRIKDRIYTIQILKIYAAILTYVITILFCLLVKVEIEVVFLLTILALTGILTASDVFKEINIANKRMYVTAFAGIIGAVISSLYRLVVVWINGGLVLLTTGLFLAVLIRIFILRAKLPLVWRFSTARFDSKIGGKSIKSAVPLLFASFSGIVMMQTDQLIIKYMEGYESVGVYGAGVRLLTYLVVFPSILSNVLYPEISRLLQTISERDSYMKMKRLCWGFVAVALGFVIFANLFGADMINVLYGAKFAATGEIVEYYSYAFLFMFLTPIHNKILILSGQERLIFSRNLLGSIVNVSANLMLIKFYGYIGAVYGTIIAQAVMFFSYGINKQSQIILRLMFFRFKPTV